MKNEMAIENWSDFLVGDIFPKKSIKKLSKKPDVNGNTEFISSTSMKNGVSGYVDEETIPGNCITVSTNGACFDAFYHDEPISVSSDVEVLYNKKLNKYNAIFICTILKLEKPKWTYGRKPKNNHVFRTTIKLPVLNGQPDWDYMEKYIKDQWLDTLKTTIVSPINDLDIELWEEFKIGDIIEHIYKAKANHKIYLRESKLYKENSIQYITRTEYNNGLDSYIDKENDMRVEKGNSITIGDTTATVFYQDIDYVCGDHIVVLRDPNLNKYVGLFLRTLLNFEKYRYSYGRAFTIDKIRNTTVMLPSKNKIPDWDFMEKYIKSLMYSDRI